MWITTSAGSFSDACCPIMTEGRPSVIIGPRTILLRSLFPYSDKYPLSESPFQNLIELFRSDKKKRWKNDKPEKKLEQKLEGVGAYSYVHYLKNTDCLKNEWNVTNYFLSDFGFFYIVEVHFNPHFHAYIVFTNIQELNTHPAYRTSKPNFYRVIFLIYQILFQAYRGI